MCINTCIYIYISDVHKHMKCRHPSVYDDVHHDIHHVVHHEFITTFIMTSYSGAAHHGSGAPRRAAEGFREVREALRKMFRAAFGKYFR